MDISKVASEKCYGCGSCVSTCTSNAIKFSYDKKGFLYPLINNDLCVDCGQCIKHCIAYSNDKKMDDIEPIVFAYKNPDKEIVSDSTSGGAFFAVSKVVLDNNGIVFGASLTKDNIVKHISVSRDDLYMLRKSKYVQSDITDSLPEVKDNLQKNKLVLFSGTPCQIDALYKYLEGTDTSNLVTVDILCHGVMSPGLWQEYVELLEDENNSRLLNYEFRSKNAGWTHQLSLAKFSNGKKIQNKKSIDSYLKIYYSNLAFRETCYACKYSQKNRVADVTLGDFWNIEKVLPEYKDEKGTSLVIINTLKGKNMFINEINAGISKKVDYNLVNQQALSHPAKRNENSGAFWKDYYNNGIRFIINRYGLVKLKQHIKNKILLLIYRK